MLTRGRLNKYDIAIIIALPAAALLLSVMLFAGGNNGGGMVRVSVDGAVYAEISLFENIAQKEIGGTNAIRIVGGAARMIYADCPDGSCLRMSEITRAGQFIVCLPNRIVVEVIGYMPPDVDAVTR
jgi:hypothetical protein